MKKFLYSILAAGFMLCAAAGCSDDPAVDNDDKPGNTPQQPKVTVYVADGLDKLSADDWKNIGKRTDEEWAEVKWTETSVIDLVRYEEVLGDFDTGVYATVIRVERSNYDINKPIVTEPETVDWLSADNTIENGDATIVVVKGVKAKMNDDGETKETVALLTNDGAELTKVTFRAEPATEVVTIVAEASGPWTADVMLTHLGGGQMFIFGIVPAGNDEARAAFIEEAKESAASFVRNENNYYVYVIKGYNPMWDESANFLIDGHVQSLDEISMGKTAKALKPSTDYKALVFACNIDEAAEDGMDQTFTFAGEPAYYKVVEANFTTPAFDGTQAADIAWEATRRNSVRADVNITVPATYTKVVYGFNAAAGDAAVLSAEEGAVFAANEGEAFAVTGKFAGSKSLNLYVAGITAEGKVAYMQQTVEQGEPAYDSEEGYKSFEFIDSSKWENAVLSGSTVNVNAKFNVNYSGRPNPENPDENFDSEIKELRYFAEKSAVSFADAAKRLTDESANPNYLVAGEGATSEIYPPVALEQVTEDKYTGEYYIYAMLVDTDDNYGRIVYLTNDAENGGFAYLDEGDSTPVTLTYVREEEIVLDYTIWAQTVKGGDINKWLNITNIENFQIGYSAEYKSIETADNAATVYLLKYVKNEFVGLSGDKLVRAIVDHLTPKFAMIAEGELIEEALSGIASYAIGEPGNVEIKLTYNNSYFYPGGDGIQFDVYAVIVVDNDDKLTLKAVGWVPNDRVPVIYDMTEYKF